MTSRTALDAYELATSAKADIESHEDLCAERYKAIRSNISDIKTMLKWGVGAIGGMAATLFGFMAHELYNNNEARLAHLERPAASQPYSTRPPTHD
jgi:hypothetical protein